MKKLTKKILEARLNDIMNELTPEDYERMERAKERAYAEYMRRQSLSVQPKKSKKKSFRYYAMVACAIAIAFLVVPIVYTAFFPVTISNAHSIVRQAGLWLNNTFHLNIEIPEPAMEERIIGTPIEPGSYSFASETEVAAYIGGSILALDCETTDLALNSISANILENGIMHISLNYSCNEGEVYLSLESLLTDISLSPHLNAEQIISSACPLYYWKNSSQHRAIALTSTWNIQLRADISISNAITIFSTLHVVN